jgi:flagellar biosynthetic protein FliR
VSTLELTSTEILGWVMQWVWPFFRIAGLVMTAPLLGTKSTPLRIRLITALALAAVLAPLVSVPTVPDPMSPAGMLIVLQQVLIGATLGLAVRLVFLALEVGGQIIAQQMGLGFAAMVDPMNGAQVPVISQFYIVLGTLTYLGLNGHLVLIEVLASSFKTLPVSGSGIARDDLWLVSDWAGWLITQAVVLALPAIVSLMVVNLALAVVARAAPQLNIISVGFPFMIVFGMFIVLFTAGSMAPLFEHLFDQSLNLARTFAVP